MDNENASESAANLGNAGRALGLASAIGLIAALLSDGIGDLISWGALALPIVAVVWHGRG
jgi:uncharacterized membrane protein YjfL (UPF0719 family)